MASIVLEPAVWSKRRKRAAELKERWPFASEVLAFYELLLDVQEAGCREASRDLPQPAEVAAYAAERIVPRVVEVSVAGGPAAMSAAVLERFHAADFEAVVRGWLRGEELSPIERYLARKRIRRNVVLTTPHFASAPMIVPSLVSPRWPMTS